MMKIKNNIYYKVRNSTNLITVLLIILLVGLTACEKYLDAKPDPQMIVPSTLDDCQLLIDNFLVFNRTTEWEEIASDDYYLTYSDWKGISDERYRDAYTWNPLGEVYGGQWSIPYRAVFYANLVLEILDEINPDENPEKWKELKGDALFSRACAFFRAAQLFAQPYDATTANQDLGIPLRLSSDINIKSKRETVQQTYEQIIKDLKESIDLLPAETDIKTRPSQPAAYAALARTYLAIHDYSKAGESADACLNIYNTLLDFNKLSTTHSTPIKKFNEEVLFHSVVDVPVAMNTSYANVDSNLIDSYNANDLRLNIFFNFNKPTNTYRMKGTYAGNRIYLFTGFAVDEMYLTRAECYARVGNVSAALADLNLLMEKRWKQGTFVPFTATDANEALTKILQERRKELVFRGIRWFDLRRLNKESQFAITLKRVFNDNMNIITYELPPNDLRYTFLIPQEVIQTTDLKQNPR